MGASFAVLMIIGLVWVYLCSPQSRMQRALAQYRRVDIKDARNGELVVIIGQVRLGTKVLQAPVSKTACCYYHLQIDQPIDDSYERLVDETQIVDFYVDDGTGWALVALSPEPDTLIVVPEGDVRRQAGLSRQEADALAMAFFASRGLTAAMGAVTKLKESLITQGETVAVIGQGAWQEIPRAAEGMAQPQSRYLVFRAPPTILVTTDPTLLAGPRSKWRFLPIRCASCGTAIPTRIIDFSTWRARCPRCGLISQVPDKG